MQIVINIDKKVYGLLKYFESALKLNDKENDNDDVKTALMRAVINGTPLPQGHGDLVDRDAINSRYNDIYTELHSSNQPTYKELLDKLSMCLDTSVPIIEADEE